MSKQLKIIMEYDDNFTNEVKGIMALLCKIPNANIELMEIDQINEGTIPYLSLEEQRVETTISSPSPIADTLPTIIEAPVLTDILKPIVKPKARPIKPRKESAYLYDRIVKVNEQQITTHYVKTLDYDERMALVQPLFDHFRKQGWLYPDDPSKIKNSWKKLCDHKPNLLSNELFNNSSLATDICKYFCHKFYDATENKKATMKEVFASDEKLLFLIKNRLGFSWWDKEDNDETFNISFRMLVQGMRSSRLVPSISVFKPDVAKYLCMKYSDEGDTVFDYSAGWGGRMLGAASCNRKYIGVDPWTTDELEIMKDYLELKDVTLINSGSEDVRLAENSVDFAYSSPPYGTQEYYTADDKQAYAQGEDYFYNTYWKKTLENSKHMLKPGKWFGLNVKNYPKMLEMAEEVFGEQVEQVNLLTVRGHLNKSAGVTKNEYVYMFRNNK